MSRRREAKKRVIAPDAIYHSVLIAKLINMIMFSGKKRVAEGIVYGAMDIIKKKASVDSVVEYVEKAHENIKPFVEVRSRRVGGATYQVPCEIRPERRSYLALKWIRDFSRKRTEKASEGSRMMHNLAQELIDAYNNQGGAIKKKEEVHKIADANKAFMHFRWS